jgi:hypothetical protein
VTRLAAILFCTVAAFTGPANAQRALAPEQAVKAAFLGRFASFVTWPATAFADPLTAIRLCVVGADPFGPELDRAVAQQRANDRTFELQRIAAAATDGCHIVYASGEGAEEALRATRGRPVLTVTDGASASRGVIHFAVVEHRVRFYIDDAQAAENGLTISSRLLSIAVAVRRRSGS